MTGHIFIYGGIGSGPGEVSIKAVKAQLDPSADDYVVHMVSPGGEVFEGYGIYNILKNSGKPIVTHVEGLCASIATLIAFAGDKIIMNKTSEFMIHNPKISDLKGDASDLRNVANQLDVIKSLLIDVSSARAARNGGSAVSRDEFMRLYDNETWLTAQQAKEFGFVDEVVDAIKAVARVDFKPKMMEKNVLATLFKKFTNSLTVAKIKNEFTETLENGKVIVVASEDGAWEGKPVFYEDGSPVEDGEHPLKSGKVITVAGGVITTVAEGQTPAAKQEDTEMNNKIQELEAQLAEAKAAKETAEASAAAAQAAATTAKAETSKIQNRVTGLERDFLALKEAAGITIGDTTPPPVNPNLKDPNAGKNPDPMGDDALSFYKTRNVI